MKRLLHLLMLRGLQDLYAQPDVSRDSLLKVLSLSEEDANKVLTLITTGQYVEYNNLEEAKDFYLQAKLLSEKIKLYAGFA